ncbi:unnamed protein product [Penicillium manginii]
MRLYQYLFFLSAAATATAAALNETCASSRECSRDSYCDMITSTCADKAKLGTPCIADCHCAEGVCYGGICKRCAADDDCNEYGRGYEYCDLSTWTCNIQVQTGETCTNSNMCRSKHCYQGTCKQTSEGESCVTAADCEGNERYLCSPSKKCIRANRPNGEGCELSGQCLSGLCSNGNCKAPDGSWGTTYVEGGKSCIHAGQQWVDYSKSGCTAPGFLCTSDKACCSKSCKASQIIGLWQCA